MMDFKRNLIVGVLKDETVLSRAIRAGFKPFHFDEELYQYIYKAALSISSRDRVTQEVLESYIKSDKEIHDKEKKIFLQSVEDLYDEDDAGSNISLEV